MSDEELKKISQSQFRVYLPREAQEEEKHPVAGQYELQPFSFQKRSSQEESKKDADGQ